MNQSESSTKLNYWNVKKRGFFLTTVLIGILNIWFPTLVSHEELNFNVFIITNIMFYYTTLMMFQNIPNCESDFKIYFPFLGCYENFENLLINFSLGKFDIKKIRTT